MKPTNRTIFIVEDDTQVSHALYSLFTSVRFNVETFKNAVLFLEKFNPDKKGCIIIDVRMPMMSGLELLEHLKRQKNLLPVIMMTGFGDIAMAVRAMKLGAIDFVLKPFNDQCLLEMVEKHVYRTVALNSYEHLHERMKLLSDRERQVLELIAEGKLNKEIAYELVISISTVEAHRANIMRKMQAKNLAQLIKFFLQGLSTT